MPLTVSHPAVVLPLRRLGLPLSALAIGSMVPDVPLFLGSVRGYGWTHTPWGVVTIDVALGSVGLMGLKWAQYASGVVGLAIVVWSIAAHLARSPVVDPDRPARVLPSAVLVIVVAAAGSIGVVSAGLRVPDGLPAMAFDGVVASLTALVLGVVLTTAAWQVAVRGRNAVT